MEELEPFKEAVSFLEELEKSNDVLLVSNAFYDIEMLKIGHLLDL